MPRAKEFSNYQCIDAKYAVHTFKDLGTAIHCTMYFFLCSKFCGFLGASSFDL